MRKGRVVYMSVREVDEVLRELMDMGLITRSEPCVAVGKPQRLTRSRFRITPAGRQALSTARTTTKPATTVRAERRPS